jgi:hypothetical protein
VALSFPSRRVILKNVTSCHRIYNSATLSLVHQGTEQS